MSASTLDNNQLDQVLDKVFQHMEKTMKITISGDAKDDAKKQMKDALYNQLRPGDENDVNVQKKLMAAVTSLLLGKDKEFNERIDLLKDEHERKEPDPKLDNKLKLESVLIKAIHETFGKDKQDKSLFAKLMNALKTKMEPKDGPKKDKQEMEKEQKLTDELDATLRNLYGGDNPSINGEIQFPILGPVFGNLLGWTNQTISDPKGLSEMVESNTYNAGKPDDLGLENALKIADLGEGIDLSPSKAPRLVN